MNFFGIERDAAKFTININQHDALVIIENNDDISVSSITVELKDLLNLFSQLVLALDHKALGEE
jgi:uncharacterized protein with GYD domain